MALGGVVAVVLGAPALVTGAALYADGGGGLGSRRAYSPLFLVPGGASVTAGVVLLAVGLARGKDDSEVQATRALHVVVAPRQVAVGGAF